MKKFDIPEIKMIFDCKMKEEKNGFFFRWVSKDNVEKTIYNGF
jgi:dTDP-4-dehydrorhamnose 3,5-epimerase-like enzyme